VWDSPKHFLRAFAEIKVKGKKVNIVYATKRVIFNAHLDHSLLQISLVPLPAASLIFRDKQAADEDTT